MKVEYGGSVVDGVCEDLMDMIRRGDYLAGDQLPSLRALAHRYGVGLNSVRSAIRRLQAEGIVETRQGVGAIVRAPFAVEDLLNDGDLGSGEARMLSHIHYDPAYELAGVAFMTLRAGLVGAAYVDCWWKGPHEAIIEWRSGPSIGEALERLLPRTSGLDGDLTSGVPGLRLVAQGPEHAELYWFGAPDSYLHLRRLRETG